MLTLGVLAVAVGLIPLAILFALGRQWTLEVAFIHLAWVPVAALVVQAILWRPMMRALSYGFLVPPLLTCIVSLFFGIVGATLLAMRPRAEHRPGLLRSTILASVPGAALVAFLLVSVVRFLVRS